MGLELALWRAVAIYRIAALGYAAVLIAKNAGGYRHPLGGWAVLVVMTAWTAYSVYAYTAPITRLAWTRAGHRARLLLAADMLIALGCLLATAWVETAVNVSLGRPTLPASWVAAAVLSWAVAGGRWAGLAGAVLLGAGNVALHALTGGPELSQTTFNAIVLLVLAGLVVGHVVTLARQAEARLARAVEIEAATRERERLARRIHDSVLQVLALVQRRGSALGGEAAELGRLAGEQEAALRALVGAQTAPAAAATGGETDLGLLLTGCASGAVTVSTPAAPVSLPDRVAREIEASVRAALDNVTRHCGADARAWVLLEADDAGTGTNGAARTVTVSIRDDGPGITPGRLTEAAAEGRLGVAQSIQGRVRDLGGEVSITSAPGEGTEIEMNIPIGTP